MQPDPNIVDRRGFLAGAALGLAGFAAGPGALFAVENAKKSAPRAASSRRPASYTYKTVGPLQIKADVYRPDDNMRRPVLLWIHGGALIMGDRGGVDRRLKEPLLDAGYCIVSIDYRLAPETRLPQIIEDLRDAYTWLHEKGPALFNVDTNRIAVAGGSAGGYLTLMSGFCVSPRPAALVSLWGYGDIAGDWYIKPSEFYRRQPLVSKEDAWKGMTGPAVTTRKRGDRSAGRFYLYCRQNGLWTTNVAGIEPRSQDAALTPYCPARNVTKEYPPTLLIHGTDDTDVPHGQSVQMDRELSRAGVEHEFISVPHAGHGLPGGDTRDVAHAYAEAVAFVDRHVRQK